MDLSVPYSGKWPNDAWLPDFVSDDEEDVMLGDFGQADDVDEADDDGGDDDGEEGDDGDDDDEDSPDEDEIERFCQSIEIVDENLDDGDADEVDGEDSVVEYVPDVVELLAPVVAVPAPKRANPEPLAPNPRPYAKRKCWTFGQKVSAIQKMERLSLTLCQAEKDLCIPFSNLQKWKKNKAKIFKEFYKATAQGWRDQTRQRDSANGRKLAKFSTQVVLSPRNSFASACPEKWAHTQMFIISGGIRRL